MKKIIPVYLLLMLSSFSIFAQDFSLFRSITCYPDKETYLKDNSKTEPFQLFTINFSKDGKFVVWNNNWQYPSFTQNLYFNIWNQVGGVTSAEVETFGNVARYKLKRVERINIENGGYVTSGEVRTLLIDISTMTYVARTEQYAASKGVCWNN